MAVPLQCPCIECPKCGVRYVISQPTLLYGNGAMIEVFPVGDSDSRRLLCSCGDAYVFSGSAVKNYSISQVAYERGFDYDIVPRAGIEDY
jgi:hypothetical protein